MRAAYGHQVELPLAAVQSQAALVEALDDAAGFRGLGQLRALGRGLGRHAVEVVEPHGARRGHARAQGLEPGQPLGSGRRLRPGDERDTPALVRGEQSADEVA